MCFGVRKPIANGFSYSMPNISTQFEYKPNYYHLGNLFLNQNCHGMFPFSRERELIYVIWNVIKQQYCSIRGCSFRCAKSMCWYRKPTNNLEWVDRTKKKNQKIKEEKIACGVPIFDKCEIGGNEFKILFILKLFNFGRCCFSFCILIYNSEAFWYTFLIRQ